MMAAGLVTLAHRSGGPLMDIVVEEESSRNGFLASHDQVKKISLFDEVDSFKLVHIIYIYIYFFLKVAIPKGWTFLFIIIQHTQLFHRDK